MEKAVADAWLHLAISCGLLLAFGWVFVWLMSTVPTSVFAGALRWMPNFFKAMIQVPLGDLASPLGRISVLLVHLITILVCIGWALGRGSNSVSGEIGRGTMDLLLSLPVRRVSVLVAPAVVAAVGAALLVGALLAGVSIALWLVKFEEPVSVWRLLPGAANLFCLTFCVTDITTLVSSLGRDRWRTIAIAGGIYVAEFIIDMVRRIWTHGAWLKYGTLLSAFRPQEMIFLPAGQRAMIWQCDGVLIALGLVCYLLAAVALARRDIPAAR